ncbi:MAG: ABC transporter substrate-binding protein [Acidimicrobiales bacterium]
MAARAFIDPTRETQVTNQRRLLVALLCALGLIAASCGSDGADDSGASSTDGDSSTNADSDSGSDTDAESDGDADGDGDSGSDSDNETDADTGDAADTILIGAAIDLTANMAPFDAPALTAAQITVDRINGEGGVLGRQLELVHVDTALDPDQTKSAAVDLLGQGADILMVTCDIDFATPAVQEGINAGVLTIAPCIGTDQMGPSRFGDAGRLAFSLGNVAQDEGAALAEYAIDQNWETAIVVPDNLLVYFQDVCAAFTKRFEELGGSVVATEGFASFDGSVNNLPTAVDSAGEADVIALCTFPPDIATAVGGIRGLGIDTPMLSPWSGDGTFWSAEDLDDFTFSTFASVFGDDPSAEVSALVAEMDARGNPAGTGGFIVGAAAIETIAAAIEAVGSTDGAALADYLEALSGLETTSGEISFSPELHTVFGREYRMMKFENGTPVFQELRAATSPADIDG